MSNTLEGASQLGKIYDVKNGKFADSSAVYADDEHQLFDFGDGTQSVTINDVDYDYSDNQSYQNLRGAALQTTESYSMNELYTTTSVSLNLSGSYGAFSSELDANYDSSYLKNTAFYAYSEKRLYQLYALQINASLSSDRSTLIGLLKAEVAKDIADIQTSADADAFIEKYGTHFLYKGIYGGRWKYCENISEYYYSSSSSMSAKFTANYNAYEGSISASSSTDSIQDSSQSDGHFMSTGGDADTLSDGFDAWANSIEEQNKHVLCDFDDTSLQPVSLLTTDTTIAGLLEDAIDEYLAYNVNLEGFQWDGSDPDSHTVGSDGTEAVLRLDDSSQLDLVVIGLALKASNSEITRSAFKVASLSSNDTKWITSDGSTFNSADYEKQVELDSGYVTTGIGFRVGDGNVKRITLYYQSIDPNNIHNNGYLTENADDSSTSIGSITVGDDGDNHYREFNPGSGNDRIIVGAGFRVKDEDSKGLTVYTAPLTTYSTQISTSSEVNEAAEAEVVA